MAELNCGTLGKFAWRFHTNKQICRSQLREGGRRGGSRKDLSATSLSVELKSKQSREPKREAPVDNTGMRPAADIRSPRGRQGDTRGEAGERDVTDTQEVKPCEE